VSDHQHIVPGGCVPTNVAKGQNDLEAFRASECVGN
jgi:hypothetical protein